MSLRPPGDTFADMREDLEILSALADDALGRLASVHAHLAGQRAAYQEDGRQSLLAMHDALATRYQNTRDTIGIALRRQTGDTASLLATKRAAANTLRSLHGIMGSLMCAGDWESPTSSAAVQPRAGVQTGKIHNTLNDYKRDQSLDAESFEGAFVSSYLQAGTRLNVKALATSSGMAALTTILAFLEQFKKMDGPILLGAHSYFQTKVTLHRKYGDRVHDVEENDADGILRAVQREAPCVIFLDSLCNAQSLPMPDLGLLLPALARTVTHETYLVLDNSGLAAFYNPLRDLPFFTGPLRLIVWESLNKYYQFGFDRVTGGIVWNTSMTDYLSLFVARMHAGTVLPDASVHAIPRPNRPLLLRRLRRIGRNARWLAKELDMRIHRLAHTPFSHVVYPGLASHPAYAWTQKLPFHGGSFVFAFKDGFQSPWIYRVFLMLAMTEARLHRVDIVVGTSFGMDATRLYLTALHTRPNDGIPFLRVSVGTETAEEMEKIERVLSRVIDVMSGRLLG